MSEYDSTRAPKRSASSIGELPTPHRDDDTPIGESAAFLKTLRKLERYASIDDVPVLLEGESGTGKSMLAQYLHALSPRARGPFVIVDSGTLDDELASAALFGNLRGAFTGAHAARRGYFVAADGGTIFLDEIGKASREIQNRLLRAVEQHEITPVGADRSVHVDVRVVCATNVPLRELVARRAFAEDLAWRIRTCTISVSPLRDRRADIPLLVRHFVDTHAVKRNYLKPPTVSGPLMKALTQAAWPGNIRELHGALDGLLIEAFPATTLGLEHCDDEHFHPRALVRRKRTRVTADDIAQLVVAGGTIRSAAGELGISLPTAYRRLQASRRRAGLPPESEAPVLRLRLSQNGKNASENSHKPES